MSTGSQISLDVAKRKCVCFKFAEGITFVFLSFIFSSDKDFSGTASVGTLFFDWFDA